MLSNIPTVLFERLIRFGINEESEYLDALVTDYCRFWKSGAWNWDSWDLYADALNPIQLVALIKALTVIEEKHPLCSGASGSVIIRLFRAYSTKYDENASDLTDWIKSRNKNDYLPFGTLDTGGARSWSEFRLYRKERQHARQLRLQETQPREQKRYAEAQIRRAIKATKNLPGAIRRKDRMAVAALRRQGADINTVCENGQSVLDLASSFGILDWLLNPIDDVERPQHEY